MVPVTHCLAPSGRQGFRLSPYFQEKALLVGQALPFDQASALIEELLGEPMSDKQIERVCHYYGQVLEAEKQQEPVYQATEQLHYAMMDGSMVFIRQEGWREIKLGRVFAERDSMAEKQRGTIRESRYVAHLGGHDGFLEEFDHLLSGKKQLVALADGARWIWQYWDTFHPEAIQILDFYHVVEKIGQWASLLFTDPAKQQEWMDLQEQYLLTNQAREVIDAITSFTCQGEKKKLQDQLLTYLKNNLDRMHYQTYREKGYHIGSGAIEAAHRNVIQKRLKLSGQRWTAQGLQQVANLRVAYLSNQWECVQSAIRSAA